MAARVSTTGALTKSDARRLYMMVELLETRRGQGSGGWLQIEVQGGGRIKNRIAIRPIGSVATCSLSQSELAIS